MKRRQSDERLALKGNQVKLWSVERAVRADAGLGVDYFRFTIVNAHVQEGASVSGGAETQR